MNTQEKIAQRRQEAAKAQQRNKKRSSTVFNDLFWKRLLAVVVALVVVVGVFALIFPQTGWSRRVVSAVTIGDEKVSVAEYSYYYRGAYNSYYQTMVNYLGEENVPIDTTKPLDKQYMSTDQTYADYFSENAINTLSRLMTVEKAAKNAGYAYPETAEQQFEATLANIDNTAAYYGMDRDTYLGRYYGQGFNEDLLKKCLMRELLVSAYETDVIANTTYTDEDLDAYYQANRHTYDRADVRIMQFASGDSVTIDEAKAQAEAFMKGIKTEDDFEKAATEKFEADGAENIYPNKSLSAGLDFNAANALDPQIAGFIFDQEHTAGDMEVIIGSSAVNYYVIYIVSPAQRDETNVANARHILFQCDTTDAVAMDNAKTQAEDVYQQFKDQGATEDVFAALANQYSMDGGSNTNGGLYEALVPGQTVATFNDWCFDPDRKVGDTEIIESEYGYHIMYMSGFGEPAWKVTMISTRQNEDFDNWLNDAVAKLNISTSKFGMTLRNEPI